MKRTVPSRQMTEAGIPRYRAQCACSNCAAQKLKCSGDHNGCQRCAQNELVCQYPERKRLPKHRAASSHQVASRYPRKRMRQLSALEGQSDVYEQLQENDLGSSVGTVVAPPKALAITSRRPLPPCTSP